MCILCTFKPPPPGLGHSDMFTQGQPYTSVIYLSFSSPVFITKRARQPQMLVYIYIYIFSLSTGLAPNWDNSQLFYSWSLFFSKYFLNQVDSQSGQLPVPYVVGFLLSK